MAKTEGNEPADPSRRPQVLVTCSTFDPGFRGGGPVRSVIGIIDSAPPDVDILLVTRDRDLGENVSYAGLSGDWVSRGASTVYYLDTRSPRQWWELVTALRRRKFDLLYVNSLWEPVLSVVPILAVAAGVLSARTVLIAPRGELSPDALAIKPLKKRLFLRIWSRALQHIGAAWHASTASEALDIRVSIPRAARVVVCADQRVLPVLNSPPPIAHRGATRFVFVGRICFIKNLKATIDALARVTGDAVFDIYGPIEDTQYWDECRTAIRSLPANVTVRYQGPLSPADVIATLVNYDAFVFPTLSENFGHVIAESLSACCPVICSDRTPWTAVLTEGGGAVLARNDRDSLVAILNRWIAMTESEVVAARLSAGAAFERWLREQDQVNVLELVLSK